ncbi:MAG: hypothetical protein IJ498_00325 [Akkermansia sp.]|nr:hypothetical protein [Akkermansia sp.]
MKITPVTTTRTNLIPLAAILSGSAAMVACQQQPQGPPGAPLPPPETEMRADADIQLIPNIEIREPMDKDSQPLPGRKAVP